MSWNSVTDITQILLGDSLVYFMALGLVVLASKQYPTSNIVVIGHSLGGGLAQFSTGSMRDTRITAYGYNSAGLSFLTMKKMGVPEKDLSLHKQIFHLHLEGDIIFKIGNQLGVYFDIERKNKEYCAHYLEAIRKNLPYSSNVFYYLQ